MKHYNKESKL